MDKPYEAVNSFLIKIFSEWLDFEYWATLQLTWRGEWSQENIAHVCALHEEREARLKAFGDEEDRKADEMYKAEKTNEEVNAYLHSRHDERYRLIKEWRSLY